MADQKPLDYVCPDDCFCRKSGFVLLSHLKDFRHDNERHNIPLGAIVEIIRDDENASNCLSNEEIVKTKDGKEICIGILGTIRAFVVGHSRDCDGTPLYILAFHPIKYPIEEKTFSPLKNFYHFWVKYVSHGWPEDSLNQIGQVEIKDFYELIDELRNG
jgi:hypothetical protein